MSKKEPKELNVSYLLEKARITGEILNIENRNLFSNIIDTRVPVRVEDVDLKEGKVKIRIPNSKRSKEPIFVPFRNIYIWPKS